ncbi:MAG: hypothetical protein AAF985_22920 [Bacteroidota bacterium]
MGFFNRLFGGSSETSLQPKISFGRYTDSYKNKEQYDAWDASLEKFEAERYLESYKDFFRYLRDEEEDNVRCWEENGGLRFELYQGSKKILGFADYQKVNVEAKIAHSKALNLGFLRRLVEDNFNLKHSRFALDDENNITIKFDTYTLDGSPYKLYYALKEVATKADKQDDLLLDEFQVLEPIETGHLRSIPDTEKEAKYQFIVGELTKVLGEVNDGQLNREQYPGGIAYLLLNCSYKLDYLTRPEGVTMETLERLHRLYFAKEDKSMGKKIGILTQEFGKLVNRPKEDYFKEMYLVTSTFGITNPVNHDRVKGFIDGELPNMDWYQENGYEKVALAIPGYIVGYCMFNYAIPLPDRSFFHLYYQIIEADYFKSLGFTANFYDSSNQRFNKRGIKKAIRTVVEQNQTIYPKLSPKVASLDYSSLVKFAKSYLLMIRNLDLMKAD